MSGRRKIKRVTGLLFSTTAKKYPLFFVLLSLRTILEVAQPFLSIFTLPLIVDEICGGRSLKKLVMYALLLIVGECVLNSLHEGVLCRLHKYQERLNNYFTMETGKHSMKLDFQLTENKDALDQLDKAKTGMTWYSGGAYGISEQVFLFIGNAAKLAGFVTLLLLHAPWMLVILTAFVIINGIVTAKCNAIELKSYGRLSKINRLYGYFGWGMTDFRYGKDLRLYDAGNMIVNRWEKINEESNGAWKWQGDNVFRYRRLWVAAKVASVIGMYLYVGLLAVKGIISIGVFTQMIETTGALDATLNGLVWNVQELIKRCNYAYEYVLFMEYPEALEKGSVPVPKGAHEIEFRDVSFAYPGTDKPVLDHVSIKIKSGEKLSVVGLNGAGKTTFIKLLCRLYDPTSGQILLDGRDIKEYDYEEYMMQFAPVFQDFKMLGFTLGENIIPKEPTERTPEENERLNEVVKKVELEELVNRLEKGTESTVFTVFDEDGIEPSGGEQQKMAIARALCKNAPVIILDEPTAALDPIAEYEIYRQFHSLVGNKTAFYISHRLSSCRFCDKIAVFSEGRIAEYGSHDELVGIEHGIYAAMFEAQAQYYR